MRDVNKSDINNILNWCVKKFGKSEFQKDLPKIRIYKSSGISTYKSKQHLGSFGRYNSNNTIIIFLGTHRSMLELCDTIIHEYTHYLLDLNEFNEYYRMLRKICYNEDETLDLHPHEVLADNRAKRWYRICYNQIRKERS